MRINNTILNEMTVNMKEFYDKLEYALKFIIDKYEDFYNKNDAEKEELLKSLVIDLERFSNFFDNYGYTRQPIDPIDLSGGDINKVINRYITTFKDYLKYNESNVETINISVKQLLTILDKNKSNY